MSENDVFSALNIGSGLNTTELIQNLLTAERAPKEKKINDKIEKNEVSISAIAELKKSLSDSSKTIDSLENTNVFQGSSTSTSINLTVTDPATVKEMSSSINVSQIATSQTLVFDGFSSETANVGDGDLLFQRGTWNNGVFTADTNFPESTVNISASAYSLTDIKDKVNTSNLGITASVVKKDTDDYALVFRSNSGLNNAFKTALGMSFISMISMEITMNLTDYFLTGGAILTWWVVPIMLIAGFLTPWPYNYWRLKKFGINCH